MTVVSAPSGLDLGTPVPPSAAARIRQITDYWIAARPAKDLLPGRQHVDPMDLSTLLPDLWLIDVVREPERIRFRYRLQGTRLVGMTGRSFRGLWADDVNVGFLGSFTESCFLTCIETGLPNWRRGTPLLKHAERFAELERVYLPLAADGRTVDMLLNMTIFYDTDGNPVG